MKSVVSLVCLLLAFCSTIGQDTRWQQRLAYHITAVLDDSSHSLNANARIRYVNQSPDTLSFIWFHIWPNAYKNDRTAFSDQLLENGRTDFYFSAESRRGYINRLDFRVNGLASNTVDHPQHQDIIQLILPDPLLPGDSVDITTPYHLQLPSIFSRSGYEDGFYAFTQWFPKPAVYDNRGWHPMPYLDQGEFYAEFADFQVEITLPANFRVAATGVQVNETPDSWVKEDIVTVPKTSGKTSRKKSTKPSNPPPTPSTREMRTWVFSQAMAHDFAWFASPDFQALSRIVSLPSGKQVQARFVYREQDQKQAMAGLASIERALLLHSQWIGEYPYESMTVVKGPQGFSGGMEYPTITIIDASEDTLSNDLLIFHEIGHNWFYGALANNERAFPWMDEGFNSYYDFRYLKSGSHHHVPKKQGPFPDQITLMQRFHETMAALHIDQPISTAADSFSKLNYQAIAYGKAGDWLGKLEKKMGSAVFDSCIRTYYQEWKNRHPYPDDFKEICETVSQQNLDLEFQQLHNSGRLVEPGKKTFRIAAIGSLTDTDKYNYLFLAPMLGYNYYDGLMAGLLLHNYTLPPSKFRYALLPMYGLKSGALNGIGQLAYTWYPKAWLQQIEAQVNGASFTKDEFRAENNPTLRLRFRKLSASLRFDLKEHNPRSTALRYFKLNTYLISEDQLRFATDSTGGQPAPFKTREGFMYNRLSFVWEQFRALYPYRMEASFESGPGFARLGFTGKYFFNFTGKGGIQTRLYAGKFFLLGNQGSDGSFNSTRYQLNMTGPDGLEDYTYGNYFAGRNEFEGIFSQQIMERDGFFKVRSDLLSEEIGKSDQWLAALNIAIDIPDRFNILNVLPIKIPLKIFADLGTYADVWDKDSEQSRILYDAGIQVSLFRSALNIYIPLLYSKVYSDYFTSTPGNTFFNRISFSIDMHNLSLRKWMHSDMK